MSPSPTTLSASLFATASSIQARAPPLMTKSTIRAIAATTTALAAQAAISMNSAI